MAALVYLDYNATTPLDPVARQAVALGQESAWGNPSSIHALGRRARALLDDARDRVSGVLHCKPSELIFTSGGTEANNLAVFGAARLLRARGSGSHLVCSSLEHHAVLHPHQTLAASEGFHLSLVDPEPSGVLDPDRVLAAVRPDTVLVSVMAANNETGALQPVAEIGRRCRERGVLFHTDAVQWFGKGPVKGVSDFNADLVSLCAHKLHGPKGAGLLYARSPLLLPPLIIGGSHENERRAGTENLGAILGLASVVERFVPTPVFDAAVLGPWSRQIESCLASLNGVGIQSPPLDQRLANTLAFTVEGADSLALLAALDLAGYCASSGAACAVGSPEPSHVLKAMGVPPPLARSLVRLSLGRENTAAEVASLCGDLPGVIEQVRANP